MASGSRLRGDDGAALIELALILPFLTTIVLGVVDIGRVWQMKNRLSGAAREAAAVVQFTPGSVASGCNGGDNATDRARAEDASLGQNPGFGVTVRNLTRNTTYSGCGAVNARPGDEIGVTVTASFQLLTPAANFFGTNPTPVSSYSQVVEQG